MTCETCKKARELDAPIVAGAHVCTPPADPYEGLYCQNGRCGRELDPDSIVWRSTHESRAEEPYCSEGCYEDDLDAVEPVWNPDVLNYDW